jgi:DNA-binding YbaB/EbfC family protein
MKNIGDMMKQVQQMQAKMQEVQAKLETMTVEGKAGGGLVSVQLNGKGALRGVSIDPSLLVASEKEILEDLLVAAHSEARTRMEEAVAREMQSVTGGFALPPGFKLPF